MTTMVQENLAGIRIVKAYTQEPPQEREFGERNREYLDRNMALARVWGGLHYRSTMTETASNTPTPPARAWSRVIGG